MLGLEWDDVRDRVRGVDEAAALWNTVKFLRAAAEGRVFFSKDSDSAFYAYSHAVPPQPRTIILDGTADLSTLYGVGGSVIPVSTKQPSYRNVRLFHAKLPSGISLATKRVARKSGAECAMDAVKTYIPSVTKPGDRILVYGKLDLLRFELHKDSDESGSNERNYCEWSGREIWWQNFGAGRGTNTFKRCNVYVQLDDWHAKKAVIVAKLGSAGRTLDADELLKLSCGTTNDLMYRAAVESHLVIHAKQNSARTAIRNLDDDGIAEGADLHFVNCKYEILVKYHDTMFPGAPEYTLLDHLGQPRKVSSKGASGKTGPERLAELLATAEAQELSGRTIRELTGIRSSHIDRTLAHLKVAPIVETRGWRKVSKNGVGYRLVLPA